MKNTLETRLGVFFALALIAGVVLTFGRGVGMIVAGIILTVAGAVAEALSHEDVQEVADGPRTID